VTQISTELYGPFENNTDSLDWFVAARKRLSRAKREKI